MVGNVIASFDNNGNETDTWYDLDNRPCLRHDPDGHWTETGYNPVGDVVDTVDEYTIVVRVGRDGYGRVAKISSGLSGKVGRVKFVGEIWILSVAFGS